MAIKILLAKYRELIGNKKNKISTANSAVAAIVTVLANPSNEVLYITILF